jgi:arylesterase / paraoxonase
VALLTALLYSRSGPLSLLYTNAPSRIQKVNRLGHVDVKFEDVLRNCEDVVLDTKEGFALLSCDPGRDSWNTVMVYLLYELRNFMPTDHYRAH